MKKFTLFFLVFIAPTIVQAKGRINIKLCPGVSCHKAHYENKKKTQSAPTAKRSAQFLLGPLYDIQFAENYYISTGVLYLGKRILLDHGYLNKVQKEPSRTNPKPKEATKTKDGKHTPIKTREKHATGSLVFPVMLKPFTGELLLDTRLFAQVGPAIGLRLEHNFDSQTNVNRPIIKELNRLNVSVLFGLGLEYDINLNASVFATISYYKELLNSVKETDKYFPDMKLKGSSWSFEIGIRF